MSGEPVIQLKYLHPERDADIPLPRYMTPHAAGMDICAAIDDTLTIDPGRIALVPTGLAIALPHGYEAQVRPRSGLAVKHGITQLSNYILFNYTHDKPVDLWKRLKINSSLISGNAFLFNLNFMTFRSVNTT